MKDVPVRTRRRIVANLEEGSAVVGHTIEVNKQVVAERHDAHAIPPAGDLPADPGYITVGLGLTENLGNFESLRLDVRITLPCKPTKAGFVEAKGRASALAEQFIDEERQKALGTEGITAH